MLHLGRAWLQVVSAQSCSQACQAACRAAARNSIQEVLIQEVLIQEVLPSQEACTLHKHSKPLMLWLPAHPS